MYLRLFHCWFQCCHLDGRFEQKLERLAEERGRRRTKSIEQEAGAGDESPSEWRLHY